MSFIILLGAGVTGCGSCYVHVCGSEDSLQESESLLHHVSPRDGNQVVRLGDGFLNLPSYVATQFLFIC